MDKSFACQATARCTACETCASHCNWGSLHFYQPYHRSKWDRSPPPPTLPVPLWSFWIASLQIEQTPWCWST